MSAHWELILSRRVPTEAISTSTAGHMPASACIPFSLAHACGSASVSFHKCRHHSSPPRSQASTARKPQAEVVWAQMLEVHLSLQRA